MNGNGPESDVMSWVRASLAMMFGAAACYGFLWARVNGVPLVSPDTFSAIAMAVILWWFKERTDKQQAETAAALAAAVAPAKPLDQSAPSDLGPISGKAP